MNLIDFIPPQSILAINQDIKMCTPIPTLIVAAMISSLLVSCSETYTDRRDGISLSAGDAMATNRVTHMIDPWPKASGKRNIAYNGEKAAAASERYRTGQVIRPVAASTSSVAYTQPSSANSNAVK